MFFHIIPSIYYGYPIIIQILSLLDHSLNQDGFSILSLLPTDIKPYKTYLGLYGTYYHW